MNQPRINSVDLKFQYNLEPNIYFVMYDRTYTRKRRARDIRRAAERAQRDTDAVQELAEPSSG